MSTREPDYNGASEIVEQRGQADETLEQTKNAALHLAAIVASSGDAIIGKTLDGVITSWNDAAAHIYGYSAREAIGQHISLIVPEDRRGELEEIMRALRAGRRVSHFETVRETKSGDRLDISLSISPIINTEGVVVGAAAIARDITAQKQVEKTLRRRAQQQAAVAKLGLRALETNDFGALLDEAVRQVATHLDVEYCKVLELLPDRSGVLLKAGVGWREGLVGHTVIGIDAESQAGYTLASEAPVIVEDLRTETRFSGPELLIDHRVVSGVSVLITGIDGPYGVLGAHSPRQVQFTEDDIHFLQAVANLIGEAAIRIDTEQALRRRERELTDFVENATLGLHWVGKDGVILWANQAELDLLGYTQEEYIGQPIANFYVDESVIQDILHRLAKKEDLHNYEARLRAKDGSIKHALISSNVYWEDGKFIHTRCFTRDITERVETQKKLWDEYAFRRAIEASIPAGVACVDKVGRQTYVNPAFCEMVGWTEEELVGSSPPHPYWPADEIETIQQALAQALEGNLPEEGFELCFQRRDGERFDAHVVVAPLHDSDEQVEGWLASVFDISARKRTERALRENHAILQAVTEGTTDAVYVKDRQGRYLMINAAGAGFLGKDIDDIVGQDDAQLFDSESAPRIMAMDQEVIESGEVRIYDEEATANGVRRTYQSVKAPFLDHEGQVIGVIGVSRDITERKQNEVRTQFLAQAGRVLTTSLDYEETLATVARLVVPNLADWCAVDLLGEESTIERVAVAHSDPSKVHLAHEVQEQYPVDTQETAGVPQVIRSGQAELYAEVTDEMLVQGAEDERHLELLRDLQIRSAMIVPLVARGRSLGALTLIMAESGRHFEQADLAFAEEIAQRCAISVDNARLYREVQEELAERKRVQEALRESERLLRFTLEATRVGTWNWDLQTNTVQWSENLEAMHGMAPGTFDGTFEAFFEDVMPEDRDYVRRTIEQALEAGTTYHVEYRLAPKDGRIIWVEGKGSIIKDDSGQPVRMAGICMDITERKRGEEELRRSEEEFRILANAIPQQVWTTSAEGKLNFASKSMLNFFQLSYDELGRGGMRAAIHPEDVENTLSNWSRAIAQNEPYEAEYRVKRASDDTYRWHLSRALPMRDETGRIVKWFGTSTDITGRKQNEQALREKTRTLETVNHINTVLAAELNLDKLVQTVTDAGTELSGAQFGAFFYNVYNEDGQAYMLYALSGVSRDKFEYFPMPRRTKIFGPTFDGKGIVRLDDVTKDPRYGMNAPYDGMPEDHLPVHSYLAAPVIGRSGEVLGGLLFGHEDVGVFTEQDEEIITGIASQAAIAIENARLFEAARRELAERERAEALVSSQKRILEMIIDGAPLPEVLHSLVISTQDLTDDDLIVSILLLDEEGRHLQLGAAPSLPDAYNKAIEGLAIGEAVGSCGTAAFRKETVVVSDIAHDPLWADFKDLALQHGLRACWSTPIIAQDGNVLGTFALYYKTPREPKPQHMQLVTIVTRTAAIAIERHRSERRLKELNETLEQKVVERTVALKEANTQLRQENAERLRAEQELERANNALTLRNRELQDFAYVASHDLQEPLRKIRAFSDLMSTDFQDAVGETGNYYLDRMQDAARRMSSLINDLLEFSRVSTRGRPFERINLQQVVEEVLQDLDMAISDADGQVELGDLPDLEADPTQMRQLFQNLIGNALKFHRNGVPPVVKVSASIKEDEADSGLPRARITVEDNGIGFEEKYLDRIFSPFQRLHGRSEYPGTGIGLAICRRIVERHHGEITASSTPGSGTTFVVILPLEQHRDEDATM